MVPLRQNSQRMTTLSWPVICIVGPTASGKTALAQAYAQHISGEVVSADSMQVYRGMDIGTGKIPVADRTVPYHGIDIVDPGEPFSAALFQKMARQAFDEIDSRGKQAVLAGGTGFYIRAAIDGYEFPKGEQKDNPIRRKYEDFFEEHGAQALWNLLFEKDAESAECVHPSNVKRVIRALEVHEEGESYAKLSRNLHKIPQVYDAVFIGLSIDKDVLNRRIEDRVEQMVEAGLVQEVEGLLAKGFRDGITAPQAIGYKEIVAYLDGDTSLQDALEQIKQATRRYAKRQRTWFKRDGRICWLDATETRTEDLLLEALTAADEHMTKRKA